MNNTWTNEDVIELQRRLNNASIRYDFTSFEYTNDGGIQFSTFCADPTERGLLKDILTQLDNEVRRRGTH